MIKLIKVENFNNQKINQIAQKFHKLKIILQNKINKMSSLVINKILIKIIAMLLMKKFIFSIFSLRKIK